MKEAPHSGLDLWKAAILAAMSLSLAGCQLNATLMSDEWTWLWGTIPFLLFAAGGMAYVYYRRRRQLDEWDLWASPEVPTRKVIVVRLCSTAATCLVLFAVYNIFLKNMDPRQKLVNIGLWLLGTLVGALLSLFLGLHLAEPGKLVAPPSLPPDSGRS